MATFDLDFMTSAMTSELQASSRGAVGAEARARSEEQNRSLDPLYNQLKMYSEVYRMLGWLRPADSRLTFSTTLLGDAIAVDFSNKEDLVYGLFKQCLLAVVFPNPLTNNIGIQNMRPFRWLLLLMRELDDVITKDEIVIGMLAIDDDRKRGALSAAAKTIREVRGGDRSVLDGKVASHAGAIKIQVNTLHNYTRLPLSVLKDPSLGWAQSKRSTGLYSKPIESRVLTDRGIKVADSLSASTDIRESDLSSFRLDERAHFANYGYYAMLLRSGVDDPMVGAELQRAEAGCKSILKGLKVKGPREVLYSPLQQESDEVLERAMSFD